MNVSTEITPVSSFDLLLVYLRDPDEEQWSVRNVGRKIMNKNCFIEKT